MADKQNKMEINFPDLDPEYNVPFQPMEEMFENIQFYIDRAAKNLPVIHPDWVNNPERHPMYNILKWKTKAEYQKFLETPCSSLEEILSNCPPENEEEKKEKQNKTKSSIHK